MVTERLNSEKFKNNKIFTLDKVPFKENEVTLVTGSFDLLHWGHIGFLKKCKELGNPLVVGVISKEISTKPQRPILTDEERIMILSEINCVDYVFVDKNGFDEKVINSLRPKTIVFSSGEPASQEKIKQINYINQYFPNLKLTYIPRQSGEISTTQIIDRIIKVSGGNSIEKIEKIDEDKIKEELIKYSEKSNAPIKTSSFIITKDNNLLSKGFNYHPDYIGEVNFISKKGSEYDQLKPRPMHAEIDAILNLINTGLGNEKNLTLYSLYMPCAGCAEIICRLGGIISKVIFFNDFDNNYGELILKSKGIKLEKKL